MEYLTTVLSDDTKFPRGDYREAAELALIALGVEPPRGKRFIKPGALHHARWMAKVSPDFFSYKFNSFQTDVYYAFQP